MIPLWGTQNDRYIFLYCLKTIYIGVYSIVGSTPT